MSFDEQPDPLSDAMEHIKKREREIARLKAEVETARSTTQFLGIPLPDWQEIIAIVKANCTSIVNSPLDCLKQIVRRGLEYRARAEAAERRCAEMEARMTLAECVIKAADAYDNFDCPHLAEDRCKCGLTQAQLAKEWNLAKIAYDKAPAPQIAGEAKPHVSRNCFCSAHQDCRQGAIQGCGMCAKAEIEYLERLATAITNWSAKELGALTPPAPAPSAAEGKAVTLTPCGQELWAGSTRYVCGMPQGHDGDHQGGAAAEGKPLPPCGDQTDTHPSDCIICRKKPTPMSAKP